MKYSSTKVDSIGAKLVPQIYPTPKVDFKLHLACQSSVKTAFCMVQCNFCNQSLSD